MKQTFLDECFKARMDYLRDRFPIEDFRRCFKEQYRQNGWVMIQPTVNTCMAALMVADEQHGFIFRTQHDLDVALRLLRLWGFSVTTRRETDLHREYTAYIVQLPDDYLTHHVGSDKAGRIRTGLRSVSNVDRTKKKYTTEQLKAATKDYARAIWDFFEWEGQCYERAKRGDLHCFDGLYNKITNNNQNKI